MNDEGKHEKVSREKAEASVQGLSSKSMLLHISTRSTKSLHKASTCLK